MDRPQEHQADSLSPDNLLRLLDSHPTNSLPTHQVLTHAIRPLHRSKIRTDMQPRPNNLPPLLLPDSHPPSPLRHRLLPPNRIPPVSPCKDV